MLWRDPSVGLFTCVEIRAKRLCHCGSSWSSKELGNLPLEEAIEMFCNGLLPLAPTGVMCWVNKTGAAFGFLAHDLL